MKMKTKDKKHYLIIDGEGLLHQSFHKFINMKTSDGKPTGAVFGFFKSLRMYLYRFKPDDVYVVFDNGHSKYRDGLLPNYKGHRKRVDIDYESLHAQKKDIQKVLRILSIKYIYDKHKRCNYEGDDFIAYLIVKALPRKQKYTIVTSDKDFNQLLRGQSVKIYNPRKDQLVYESNCKVIFGYSALETVDWLSLVGDASDDIPGYNGIGEKKARSFLDKYGSIPKYLDQGECLRGDPEHSKMKEVYGRNKQLIDLKWFCKTYDPGKLPLVDKGKEPDIKKLYKFSIPRQLSSFRDDIFTKTFIEQYKTTYGKGL